MRILVVGGGGREHALTWKLANDSSGPELFCAPGNAGTRTLATNLDIGAEDIPALVAWATRERPDLTVIGPEAPLCAGLSDALQELGLRVFGPTRDGARLEGSKIFCKDVLTAAGVPTAAAGSFSNAGDAIDYARSLGGPCVVKADGLAAGKGVIMCDSAEAAEQAITEMMTDSVFGDAGLNVIIEETLIGEEASILALVDGSTFLMLDSSQDHKRAYDGDRGPNTGGMGAYSPAPVVTDDMRHFIAEKILQPTIDELQRRNINFKGVLYAGLMCTADGPKVLEYNVRFGDPECQAVLLRMQSDLVPLLNACIDGSLASATIEWTEQPSVCVVMASGGYPGSYTGGRVIRGLDDAAQVPNSVVFHAGTAFEDDSVVTAGGRVLGVTAVGSDLSDAVAHAYKAVNMIHFDEAEFRRDIAGRALGNPPQTGE